MRCNRWRLASTLVMCSIAAGLCTTQVRIAHAAQDCLSAPKDSTPQGKHWYYRVDRPTKRACWYLGEEGRKTSGASTASRTSAANESAASPAPSEKPASPQIAEPLQPAIANARAELTNDIAVPFTTMPSIAQMPNIASTPRENPAPQTSEPAPPDTSQFTQRWPDQNSIRTAQADTAAAPVPAPATPTPIQQQAAAPGPSIATASSAPDDSSDVLRVILAVVTAAIALAAIVGRLILTHRRPRKRGPLRRPIWQTMVNENTDPVHARASETSLRARAEADVEELLRALRYPDAPRVTSPIAFANRAQRPKDPSGVRA